MAQSTAAIKDARDATAVMSVPAGTSPAARPALRRLVTLRCAFSRSS
jgi:hypothetical protein